MQQQQRGVSHHGPVIVLVIVVVVGAARHEADPGRTWSSAPRRTRSRRSRASGRAARWPRSAGVRGARRRSTTSRPIKADRPRDHQGRQRGGDRLRLPQGSAAVRQRRPVHRLRGQLRRRSNALSRHAALEKRLGHRFADAGAPRAGADAPQPRRGQQRAAGIPRRRRARLRGRRRALRALPAAPRRQADPPAREPGARGGARRGRRASSACASCCASSASTPRLDRPRSSPMRWRRCSARCSSTAATPRRAARCCAAFGPLLERARPGAPAKDAKTRLQELLQARGQPLPEYRVVATHGAAHQQSFEVECVVAELGLAATGSGHLAPARRAGGGARRCSSRLDERMSAHRCGTIGIAGRPNTGKSSLLNRLVGREALDRLGQAADHAPPVTGILTRAGLPVRLRRCARPADAARAARCNRTLNRRATEAARDADVALFVVEALRFGPEDHAVLERIPPEQKIVAAVNKIDTREAARRPDPVPRPPVEDARRSRPSCR